MKAPAFWEHDDWRARLLTPAAAVYAGLGWLRWQLAGSGEAPIPVICVGNATVGGTGKTPITIDLLQRLTSRGIAAHALCRGHGGSVRGSVRVDPDRHNANDVGDEALLLAATAPTWAGRDRLGGARAAAAAGATCAVLDDGLQYPRLRKRASLLIVDGATGLGNGRVVPAGPLREPVRRALSRADVIVEVGATDAGSSIDSALPRWACTLVPAPEAWSLQGYRAVAFAGIGRPEKFFASARAVGVDLISKIYFADHHVFHQRDLAYLRRQARRHNANLLTTSKDFARIPQNERYGIEVLPITVRWEQPEGVDAWLDATLPGQ